MYFIIAFNCAHKGVHVRNRPELLQRLAYERVAVLQLQLNKLRIAAGEGIALEEGGELQQAEYFKRGGLFRIYYHGKAKLVAHEAYLLIVFRVPHAGYGVLAAKLFCHHAAQKVRFVPVGRGDEQIRRVHARLALHLNAGAIAVHHRHVKRFLTGKQNALVIIYDHQVVALFGKRFGERIAHFSVAHNNYLHIIINSLLHQILPYYTPLFPRCPLC